jgi:hypothetical protein
MNKKTVLSFLWIFVLMNMIYADILNTLKPGYLLEIDKVGKTISGETVLFFAVLMEIPIAMILISRLCNRSFNRTINFIASPVTILWVVIPSLIMNNGNTPLSYIFFASVEVATMLFILYYAWKWPKENIDNSILD